MFLVIVEKPLASSSLQIELFWLVGIEALSLLTSVPLGILDMKDWLTLVYEGAKRIAVSILDCTVLGPTYSSLSMTTDTMPFVVLLRPIDRLWPCAALARKLT